MTSEIVAALTLWVRIIFNKCLLHKKGSRKEDLDINVTFLYEIVLAYKKFVSATQSFCFRYLLTILTTTHLDI